MDRIFLRIVLFLSYCLFAILLNSVGTVILQSAGTFGVTKQETSILEAFKDLPIAFVSFFVASLLPRIGYRFAMIFGFGLVAVACLAMPLIPGFLTTKLLFLTVGVAFAIVKISVYSTIGLLTNSSNAHASLLNTIEGFFMVGVLSGYWIFAAFIDPTDPTSADWLNVYWLLALMSAMIIGLLLFVDYPKAQKSETQSSALNDFIEMFKLLWRPAVLTFVFSAFLYVLIEQGIGTWLPTFNNEILSLPQAMSVQATSIFAAALAIGRFSAGFALKHVGWYPLVNLCVIAMGILILVTLPLTQNLPEVAEMTWATAPIAAFILPLVGLFMAPTYPVINSIILNNLPKERHASMAGLIVVFSALGGTTGSFIIGQVFARFDGATAFYLTLIPIAGLLATLFMFKRILQREQ